MCAESEMTAELTRVGELASRSTSPQHPQPSPNPPHYPDIIYTNKELPQEYEIPAKPEGCFRVSQTDQWTR
jgi:hypothetical protein